MANAAQNDDQAMAVVRSEGAAAAAEQVAPVEAQQQQQPQSRLGTFLAAAKSLLIRGLLIYVVTSFFRGQKPAPVSQGPAGSTVPSPSATNLFEFGMPYDLYVWLSEDPHTVDFNNSANLLWQQENLIYNDYTSGPKGDGIYNHYVRVKAPRKLMNNGSVYIHAYVTRNGESPDPRAPNYAKRGYISHQSRMLNKYKKMRANKNYNLLASEEEKQTFLLEQAQMKGQILSHWHPNLTINFVADQTHWVKGAVPAPLDEYIQFIDDGTKYLPILFFNDYWNFQRDYFPINETTPELDLHLTLQPIGMFKWQIYAAQEMRHKFAGNMITGLMAAGAADESEEEQDSLKETMMDTNPYLLGMTVAISLLHSVFELLAFKNDIQFWNNRQSLEGLSVRSVFFGVFQSLIVLLYVLDNETNFMIRVSCFIGLGIEVWKIHKVVDVKYNTEDRLFGIFPKVSFNDKGSYSESMTKGYDNLAFKYLGWLCFPLLIAYFVYSLVYNEHKGWYSFVLNMLYGYLLTFGFIMMTPQLFINYKLKSVAHLPWRMMTYKFLNTFIDDIFAFVIKMPTMYRLGCFRDDIIFFVFLYQRWQYSVDYKRVNEFGFSGEMVAEAERRKAQPITAAEQSTASGVVATQEANVGDVQPKSITQKKED